MIDDKKVQELMREFDKLHRDQKQPSTGQRFVDIDGKKLNIDEWLVYKIQTPSKQAPQIKGETK